MNVTYMLRYLWEAIMDKAKNLFWQDLDRELQDPEFRSDFTRASIRITAIDRLINELDEARVAQDLSKADLARAIGSDPAAMRRLFASRGNPTLGTLAEVAAVLGLQITLTERPRRKRTTRRAKGVATAARRVKA